MMINIVRWIYEAKLNKSIQIYLNIHELFIYILKHISNCFIYILFINVLLIYLYEINTILSICYMLFVI